MEWALIRALRFCSCTAGVGASGGERSEAVLRAGNRSFPPCECIVNSNTKGSRPGVCLRDCCYWTAEWWFYLKGRSIRVRCHLPKNPVAAAREIGPYGTMG